MGDPRLSRAAAPVERLDTPELHALVQDLWDTMRAERGAGLAATQIGVSQRVVVFGVEANPRYPDAPPVPDTVLVNPVIETLTAETAADWEGCLSLPGLRGLVPRCLRVRYRGLDPSGRAIERLAEGFHARVVQHECDHLDGILYPQRMPDMSSFGFVDELLRAGTFAGAGSPCEDERPVPPVAPAPGHGKS